MQTTSRRSVRSSLISAVLSGAEAAGSFFGRKLKVQHKSAKDVVTEADFASERSITSILKHRYPLIRVVSEEDPAHGGRFPEHCFVVDPLDATTNFREGHPTWGVMGAYVESGKPQLSVLYVPMSNELVVSERGLGTYFLSPKTLRKSRRVRFSARAKPAHFFMTCEIHRFTTSQEVRKGLVRFLDTGVVLGNLNPCSAVKSLMQMLQGQTALYLNYQGGGAWDFFPSALAIEEAGGKVFYADGRPLDYTRYKLGVLFCMNRYIAELSKRILFPKA